MVPAGDPGKRRYGQWGGNPRGVQENVTRCVESIYPSWTRSPISQQCSRKRGYGPNGEYCKQHAKKLPLTIG